MEKYIIGLLIIGLSSFAVAGIPAYNAVPKLSQVETVDGNIIQGEIINSPNGNIQMHFETEDYVFTIYNKSGEYSPTGWVGFGVPKDENGVPIMEEAVNNIIKPEITQDADGNVSINIPRDDQTIGFNTSQLIQKNQPTKNLEKTAQLQGGELPASTSDETGGMSRFIIELGFDKDGNEYIARLNAGTPYSQNLGIIQPNGTVTFRNDENVPYYRTPEGTIVLGDHVYANARESKQSANIGNRFEVIPQDTGIQIIEEENQHSTEINIPFQLKQDANGEDRIMEFNLVSGDTGDVVKTIEINVDTDSRVTFNTSNEEGYDQLNFSAFLYDFTGTSQAQKGNFYINAFQRRGAYTSKAATLKTFEIADILDTRNIELYGQASDIPNTLLSLLKGHDATQIVIIDENGVKHTVENHRITTDTLDFRSIYPAGIDMRSTGSASKDTYFDLVIDGTIRRINVGLNPSQVITNPGGGTTGGGTVGSGGGF